MIDLPIGTTVINDGQIRVNPAHRAMIDLTRRNRQSANLPGCGESDSLAVRE
jgi:hypothetical protein